MMAEAAPLGGRKILPGPAAIMAEGEVMQLGAPKNTATTQDDYLAVIRAKTAELFAAACEVGPPPAARPKTRQNACRASGRNRGTPYPPRAAAPHTASTAPILALA